LWLREKNERSYGCSPLPPEMLEVISQKLQSFDDLLTSRVFARCGGQFRKLIAENFLNPIHL
jgi:hypothetical protein